VGTEQKSQDEWLEGVRDRIAAAMKARGVSQRGLAEQLGITGSAVAQWGGRDGSLLHWYRLASVAQALGVSADWILGLPAETPALGVDPRTVQRLIRRLREVEQIVDQLEPKIPE